MRSAEQDREFESWFRKEGGIFFRVAYRLARPDRQLAEDIASESAGKFYKAWREGSTPSLGDPKIRSVCAKITDNEFIDHYRRVQAKKRPQIQNGLEVEKAELLILKKRYSSDYIDLKLAVESLPEVEQAMISLVYFAGYTDSEAGKKIELSRDQAYRARQRALRQLGILLSEGEA